jgi:sterol desaturase/sphingolipid hydroxylase (fatty acid hydroxylase superfamily)
MDEIQSLYLSLRVLWRNLLPGEFARNCASALLHVIAIYFVVLAIEKAYGTRTENYKSRDFMHDLAYYFYYRSGAQKFLFTAAVFVALDTPLSFLDLKLLSPLPFGVQVVFWLLISDFAMYWLHRAQHYYRFLWAFHSTHHAEEHLTFASFLRFHPVEVFIGECVAFVILRILGFDLNSWIAAYLVTTFLGEVQHTQIPWNFGPAYKVIVSPQFHAYHHSPDPACHDRNYGGLFSFWDYLFGTAVPDGLERPTKYGLRDVKVTSLWSTLVTPFRLLQEFYFQGRLAKHDSARPVLDEKSTLR